MLLQSIIVAVLLLVALVPFGLKHASLRLKIGVVVAFALVLGGIVLWQNRVDKNDAVEMAMKIPRQNRPGGFVGSDNCRSCHPDQYSSWHDSFHRTMTQIPSRQNMRGNFEHVRLELDGETFQLETRGGGFWVDMVDPDWKVQQATVLQAFKSGEVPAPPGTNSPAPRVTLPISLMTGSHHMQTYWVPGNHGNQQFNFPFTWLFELNRWVPRRSVFVKDPKELRWTQVWNVGCIDCHATAGQPRQKGQTAFYDTRVAEFGISCEACHGPAENHVKLNSDPARRYGLHLQKGGDANIVNPARLSSKRSAQVCGRCHSVRTSKDNNDWLENGTQFRPGEDLDLQVNVQTRPQNVEVRRGSFWSDGMIRISGREYNGLIKSPCFLKGDMSCLSCHSMHQSQPTNQLARAMEGNQACYQCHERFKTSLAQHTHHAVDSTGSLCYNCHMPYTTYGLVKGLRSHQISNPSVDATVETGRPNGCNACHLDRTLQWTADKLSEWYHLPSRELKADNRTVAASVLWALQGEAGQRALAVWYMGWKPAMEASGENGFAPFLAASLDDPYSAVRYIAGRSLQRQAGFKNFSYDFLAAPAVLQQSRESALQQAGAKGTPKAELLATPDGTVDRKRMAELLQGRNNRVVELLE